MELSKWTVYEYARQVYMRTGIVPTAEEVSAEMAGLGEEALKEGYAEFEELLNGRGHSRTKYQLTYQGKPLGRIYATKREMMAAFAQLWPTMHGLGWWRWKPIKGKPAA
ncbi:hypothetical protein GXP70_12340 [Paenibacillus lycopersici]|uniref:Uncharacterized protein n=1 Tax=Paenibacillus lycopersici TaxID=2704462 RepID=A0A6C0G275_9BACL|nr:hypothetical protein [Paenibacillus lycopersici]QHT60650.1 hypothetical protein GXP70_12340 [Paenibacillus lycopersici]